jgi:hypothetical protein
MQTVIQPPARINRPLRVLIAQDAKSDIALRPCPVLHRSAAVCGVDGAITVARRRAIPDQHLFGCQAAADRNLLPDLLNRQVRAAIRGRVRFRVCSIFVKFDKIRSFLVFWWHW